MSPEWDDQHGTRAMYVHYKCRCPRCTEANREYQREYMRGWYLRNSGTVNARAKEKRRKAR